MNYDDWKTGYYDAEPEVDYDEYCSHNHEGNREAVEGLIDALYAKDALSISNIDFIKEQLYLLARDYGIEFDFDEPMGIEAIASKETEPSTLEDISTKSGTRWTVWNNEAVVALS